MRKVFFSFSILTILMAVTIVIIAFGRGYRPDFGKRTISSTGLLLASSEPAGAQVWLDGNLKSTTNTTLTLPPGRYQVKLTKEGFLPWEKKMKIQGEVVSETSALLFPSTPALTPLTTSGMIAPTVSPDGTKIVYAVPKAGLWLLNLASPPLGFSRDPQLLARTTPTIDFSLGAFSWSTNSKKILVTIGDKHYLVEAEKESQPVFLSRPEWENLKITWEEETREKEEEKLAILPPEFSKIATTSAKILAFSPDETKILYQVTDSASIPQILNPAPIATNPTPQVRDLKPESVYIYDLKEDKNFALPSEAPFSGAKVEDSLSWFPSSRHLVEVTSNKISVLEYDGTNRATVYSGPFEKFVASGAGGRRLLILTSYNRPGLANLYSVNLR